MFFTMTMRETLITKPLIKIKHSEQNNDIHSF